MYAPLPKGKFACVAVDPPWSYGSDRGRGDDAKRNVSSRHYDTLTFEELSKLPLADSLAGDCFLFNFATSSFLPEAISLTRIWGFEYKQTIPWVKMTNDMSRPRMGTGSYFRNCAEFLIVGRRGRPKVLDRGVMGAFLTPRPPKHSQKPQEIFDSIERLCGGPRLEIFARSPREGWTVWGNEV